MRKLSLVIVLALWLVGLTGCSQEQAQQFQADVNEAAKINAVVGSTMVQLEKIKADANLTDAQKTIASMQLVGQSAVNVGLIKPEQGSSFLDGLKIAMDAYLQFAPLGAGKLNWTMLIILAYVALKNRKPKQ